MIGGAKEDAAQTQEIARDLEIHDLSPAIGQQLEGTGPAVGQNVCPRVRLPFVDHLVPRLKDPAAPVEACQCREVGIRQGDERRQLA